MPHNAGFRRLQFLTRAIMWPMCLNMYWRSNLLAVGSLSISCLMASARSPGFGIMATSSKWGIMSTVSTGSGSSLLIREKGMCLDWMNKNGLKNETQNGRRHINLTWLHTHFMFQAIIMQYITIKKKTHLRYCFNSEATTWGSWSANLTGSPELYWRRRCCTLLFTPLRR